MKSRTLPQANAILLRWIMMGFAVYFVIGFGLMGLLVISSLASFAIRWAGIADTPPSYEIIFFVPVGLIIGAAVGWLQSHVLRSQLRWTAERWIRLSMAGGVAGTALAALVGLSLPSYPTLYIAMIVIATTISVFQYWSLRNAVRYASLWILANFAAAVVYAQMPLVLETALSYFMAPFVGMVLMPLVQATITGMVIITLFERFSYPVYNERIPARVPLAKKAPSVWDEAV